jgi:hypothetical protein
MNELDLKVREMVEQLLSRYVDGTSLEQEAAKYILMAVANSQIEDSFNRLKGNNNETT